MTDSYINENELEFGDYDTDGDYVADPAGPGYQDGAPQDDFEGLGARGDAPRSPNEAIEVAREMDANRTYVGVGYCLKTVRGYYGVGAKYGSASQSWNAAEHKRHVKSGMDVPRGVPVYWTGGSHGYGHIAISIGSGLCLSTDWTSPGRVNVARIDEITHRWGLDFQGYAWEVNDVIVWKPNPPRELVRLRNLKPGSRSKDVLDVKKALHEKGYTGFMLKSTKFGRGTRKAYAKFQRRLGYTGHDADGVPGRVTLRKLGFRVKS